MNPYEQQQQPSGGANENNPNIELGAAYTNYYNPYIPSYVPQQQPQNDAVIIGGYNQDNTQQYYSTTTTGANNYDSSSLYISSTAGMGRDEPSVVNYNSYQGQDDVVIGGSTEVVLPPQKINDDIKVDPVLQKELAASSNVSLVNSQNTDSTTSTPHIATSTAAVAATTGNTYQTNTSHNFNTRRRRSWKCPSISFPSIDCYDLKYMSSSTKRKLIIYGGGVALFILALCLFGAAGALYGVVNSDPYCFNDPNGLSYVHKGCCNVTLSGCSYYKSSSYCRYTVSFPLLGSSSLIADPGKGSGIVCSANGKTTNMNGFSTYSTSYFYELPSLTLIDCYTNKFENFVSIKPYSELYAGYVTGGIICLCFASSIMFFVLLKFGIFIYVKWRSS